MEKKQNQKLLKENKRKEVAKGKLSKRMIVIKHGDLLEEHVEVIVNSVGAEIKFGFGGMIGKCIVKECGEEIVQEAIQETLSIFGGSDIKTGKFVSTSAGKSKNHKFVLHAVAPNYTDDDSEKILSDLIKDILAFCHENKVESISMPPIGSGVLGFPKEA
jgi:O-acetyl-ADP-ribose deacetylase (regulator of RNase III)